MPVDHRTHQPYGLLHGGASVVLAETLGSTAAMLTLDPAEEQITVGLDINANHIRGVRSGVVTGTARALHLGAEPLRCGKYASRMKTMRWYAYLAHDHGGDLGARRATAMSAC